MSVANKKKKECCGCNACAEICPKHCIHMEENDKGFLYPKIDHSVCVECGACERVCPFDTTNITLHSPLKAFAAWNKNKEEHLTSSSGGAAYVFSSYVLNKGGVVYGCTADGIEIRHIRVKEQSELYRLQGSKYVQSDVRGLYKKVKEDLKTEMPVLFIGTPCQVAGLRSYIRRIPENLYLIDLICHGVPSQKMLKEHAARILGCRAVEHLSFRKGQIFRIELKSQGGTVYSYKSHKDLYYKAFLNGISYRESCYQCPFARQERVGDITIGDFWGLQDMASLPLNKEGGLSVLLPISEKGQMLLNAIKPRMNIYERSIGEAVSGNEQLVHPSKETLHVKFFRVLYSILSFDKAVALCLIDYKFKTLLKIIGRKIFK